VDFAGWTFFSSQKSSSIWHLVKKSGHRGLGIFFAKVRVVKHLALSKKSGHRGLGIFFAKVRVVKHTVFRNLGKQSAVGASLLVSGVGDLA
jgi:hypothetical protein